MAVIDVPGFVADLKDHAVEHGFHVPDERHFVESYSLRQTWEVDLHPEEGCEGPVDLYLSLEIDPRVLLGFEDAVIALDDESDPEDDFHFPLSFTWALPPLPHGPDLLVLATELAGVGGRELPVEVSATDSYPSVTDAPERTLRIVAHQKVSLLGIRRGEEVPCDTLESCLSVSRFLLEHANNWLGWVPQPPTNRERDNGVRDDAHRLPALSEPHLRDGRSRPQVHARPRARRALALPGRLPE